MSTDDPKPPIASARGLYNSWDRAKQRARGLLELNERPQDGGKKEQCFCYITVDEPCTLRFTDVRLSSLMHSRESIIPGSMLTYTVRSDMTCGIIHEHGIYGKLTARLIMMHCTKNMNAIAYVLAYVWTPVNTWRTITCTLISSR